jgi:hypothetical protein
MVTVHERDLPQVVRLARGRGLDGTDKGAVRRFLWYECVYSDALDDGVTERVAALLRARAS